MQNIILIIHEPSLKSDDDHEPSLKNATPGKIGNQFMNRIAIDEEAAFEIKKVLTLEQG